MIVKSKTLDRPHGNTVIWRYIGLDKFLDLLMTHELFFSNAGKMTDQYEGLIPKRNQDYLFKSIQSKDISKKEIEIQKQKKWQDLHAFRDLTLLNCWTMSKSESYALWKIYLGGSKAGVAIRTTVSKLTKAIQKGNDPVKENIFLSKVRYADFIKDAPEDRFNIITTKNKFYDFEKELRLFIFHDPATIQDKIYPYNPSIGRRVKVNLNELIDTIYLSPFTGQWFDSTLTEVLRVLHPDLSQKIKNSAILDE